MKICYPDYNHCILGIIYSVLKHYGVKGVGATLPKLDEALSHHYKNVVFMIFDGMGVDMLQKQLPFWSYLRRHIRDKITSVFPPTTTAATTSYYSGKEPCAHGWLGWDCYFKEKKQVIELFTGKDYYTGEPASVQTLMSSLRYQHIFQKIRRVSDVKTTKIMPVNLDKNGTRKLGDVFERVTKQCQKKGKQFILTYWAEPDHSAHEKGCYSHEVRHLLKGINKNVRHMAHGLKDTLIIISADHGHLPCGENIFVNDIPGLVSCMRTPLSLDNRSYAIHVKKTKEAEFLQIFQKYLSQDFILIPRKEVIEKHLFGSQKMHPRFFDFIGDYLIVSVSDKSLHQVLHSDDLRYCDMLSAHSGLTEQEMVVPLIMIEKD